MTTADRNVLITVHVLKTDHGFVARAVELPVVSRPAETARIAIRVFKGEVAAYLEAAENEGNLETTLDEHGFRGAVDSGALQVDVHQIETVRVPLQDRLVRSEI